MTEKLRADGAADVTDVVRSYSAKITRIKAKMDGPKGELGNVWKQIEDSGLHKKAFKAAQALTKLDPTACDEYLRNFNVYCEALGLTAQGDLFEEGARQAEELAAQHGEAADYSATLAFEQGEKAGALGKAATTNPYDQESQGAGHAAWNSGWLRSQQKIASDMGNGHAEAATKPRKQRKAKAKTRRKRKDEDQPQTDA